MYFFSKNIIRKYQGLKFHFIWMSPTTKLNSIWMSTTTKFHFNCVFPTIKFHSIWMSPTTVYQVYQTSCWPITVHFNRGHPNDMKFCCQGHPNWVLSGHPKGSVIRINGGVVQHCSLMKNGIALRLCMSDMLGNSYHRAKDGVSTTTLKGFFDLLKCRFKTCRLCCLTIMATS